MILISDSASKLKDVDPHFKMLEGQREMPNNKMRVLKLTEE